MWIQEPGIVWRFVDADLIDGAYSAALFHSIGRHVGFGDSDETILFWRVRHPTLYLGYHQYVEDEVNEAYCVEHNIDIVRRILGGGCGYCDRDQILFSVIGAQGGPIPGSVQTAYKKVLSGLLLALDCLGLEGDLDPARNGVFVQGRKISGNAQGRFDGAAMVNGSFLLNFDFDTMDHVLKHPTRNLRANVKSARDGMVTLSDLMELPPIDTIKQVMRSGFENVLDISSYEGNVSDEEEKLALELTSQYASRQWTYRMDHKRAKREKV
ncbi:MAG: lipoate--protein ligase family protein [ANME-2 cluster archaeon]|nr:lipoate--protein ligase family protein [ANME-2 cluster archaeon]